MDPEDRIPVWFEPLPECTAMSQLHILSLHFSHLESVDKWAK